MSTDDDKKPVHLLRAVGNSPLLRLQLPGLPPEARLYAKLETVHPGGSLKDRPVARLLSNALEDGRLEGRRLLDAVGPAAAISYAVHAAALGLPLTLILPADIPRDLLERVAAHGAETILAEVTLGEGRDDCGPGAGFAEAKRLQQAAPERYYFGDLAASEESWQAHYDTTGHEILSQVFLASGAVPEAFVAGVGSGATLMGVGRRLLRRRADLAILAVEPAPGESLPCLQPLDGRRSWPSWFDFSLLAGRVEARVEDALETCRVLAGQGLFVGPSSGANVFAAGSLLCSGRFHSVATVLCDGGERYLSRGWRLRPPVSGGES